MLLALILNSSRCLYISLIFLNSIELCFFYTIKRASGWRISMWGHCFSFSVCSRFIEIEENIWEPWRSRSIIKCTFDLWVCDFCVVSTEERGRNVCYWLTDTHERWVCNGFEARIKLVTNCSWPDVAFDLFLQGNKQCNNAWTCSFL